MRTLGIPKPDAILTSDWHLRETAPICRTDKFWEAQWRKVTFVTNLQNQYQCPVWHAGDLFHHWKPSPYLLTKTFDYLPDQFYTVYGQHDLPQHSLDLLNKCGAFTLFAAGRCNIFGGTHFGQEVTVESVTVGSRHVLVWHNLTWHKTPPWPGCPATPATRLLDKYPDYDLILTGDNHRSFIVGKGSRLLVNPGSLTRQTADQVDHTPCVYLWYAETNTVKQVMLPFEESVISREHIIKDQERDGRIDAFISQLDTEWVASVSFEENLKRFAEENSIRQSVMDIIKRAIDE